MRELLRMVERPRRCSYLPGEVASLEVRLLPGINAGEYGELLMRGYRRFGHYAFRPACLACRQCRSLRVLATDFSPGAGERRVLRKNRRVRTELGRATATAEHVELYNIYHRFMRGHRGWLFEPATEAFYREQFLATFDFAREWRYFEDGRLIGVALMDEVPDGVSLVYCYYHPDWRPRSPGTFSILNQLLYARDNGLRYAYLGYWIEACQSMNYKTRFRPHEILREYPRDGEDPVWESAP